MTTPSSGLARSMRSQPDLEQLKRQAKELLRAYRESSADALAEVKAHYRDASPQSFQLSDAQLVIARAYGFESWPKLKEHVNSINVARLAEAVKAGDLKGVRAMLKQRPELVHLDMSENDEHRAIHYAVLNRNPEMVRLLMSGGSDARKGIYPHRDATSALTIARERGYDEIVAIIDEEEQHRREAMSCPNATVSPIQDRINDAIRRGENEVAIQLLQSDPTLIKACDRYGGTVLHVAAETLNEPMLAWLLDQRADIRKTDMAGRTPLERAVRAVDWRRENSLSRFQAISQRLRDRGAEITPAAVVALGDVERLRRYHEESPKAIVDPNAQLLTVAVQHDRIEMVRVLLDLGLDPNERRRKEGLEEPTFTAGEPLWHCAASGKYEIAELLLNRGADPNAEVYASGSAVFQAYGVGDERMKQLLHRFGGRPDIITAGLYRDTKMAKQMLDTADEKAISRGHYAGETAAEQLLWAAACGGDPDGVALALENVHWPRDDRRWFKMLQQPTRIWNHGSIAHPRRAKWDRSTYPICFRMILDRCDPNVRGGSGVNMLHDVSAVRAEERCIFAAMLLDAGIRLDVRDDLLKSTPLGWACRWGRTDLVRLLLDRGADPVEKDAEPWATPMAWAQKGNHAAIVELLRERGAS